MTLSRRQAMSSSAAAALGVAGAAVPTAAGAATEPIGPNDRKLVALRDEWRRLDDVNARPDIYSDREDDVADDDPRMLRESEIVAEMTTLSADSVVGIYAKLCIVAGVSCTINPPSCVEMTEYDRLGYATWCDAGKLAGEPNQ